ncbi:MAG TPA: amidohydrolase family protein [Verrucomicrobiae bacterium]|nr:amidohydrolase family protein [Verrucomicrobiae bacterium]
MMARLVLFASLTLALAGCNCAPPPAVDPSLAAEIARIKAIDNHAHPVRNVAGDREFDALPVDNMEPQSDPVALRPGAPPLRVAAQFFKNKAAMMKEKGDQYPAWVLDQAGIDIMFANRVAMGSSIQPPRFRWVGYVDALIFPLDNTHLAERNSDRKSFFALEDQLRARYLKEAGLGAMPATLADYLSRVVTPTLERHRQGGAVAEKFEAAYLRSLAFDPADRAAAERVWAQRAPSEADYKVLQDYLFRYVAGECGRLGMAVHLHTMAGAGGYFDVGGANPLNLESVLNEPSLRQTKFVMVHGGWPFTREITALMTKPNAYLDFSGQGLSLPPAELAGILREWLAFVPEKILFATDAYPYSNEMGWEESVWLGARNGREALGRALTEMMAAGEIDRQRAGKLARMVLRDNARALYGL